MITCKIVIQELPDQRVAATMEPDNTHGTELEKTFATILDFAIQTGFQYFVESAVEGSLFETSSLQRFVRAELNKKFQRGA